MLSPDPLKIDSLSLVYCDDLFLFLMSKTITIKNTVPPTAPPAIAPVFDFDFVVESLDAAATVARVVVISVVVVATSLLTRAAKLAINDLELSSQLHSQ